MSESLYIRGRLMAPNIKEALSRIKRLGVGVLYLHESWALNVVHYMYDNVLVCGGRCRD